MLNMNLERKETELILHLEGRLDSNSSPDFEKEVKKLPGTDKALVVECGKLRYVSSVGLRVILLIEKMMKPRGGRLIIRNANSLVMEILDATGLTDILTIENDEEV